MNIKIPVNAPLRNTNIFQIWMDEAESGINTFDTIEQNPSS